MEWLFTDVPVAVPNASHTQVPLDITCESQPSALPGKLLCLHTVIYCSNTKEQNPNCMAKNSLQLPWLSKHACQLIFPLRACLQCCPVSGSDLINISLNSLTCMKNTILTFQK